MNLFVLRHAKAEDAETGSGDAGRPLTARGRDDAAGIGKWLALQGYQFDLIATSPIRRALETGELVAGALAQEDTLEKWEALSTRGSIEEVMREIGRREDLHQILIIGHEPLLSGLIGRIIGGGHESALSLGKGGLARIRDATCGDRLSGSLQWLLTSKQILSMK